mmetsp:Transcript_62292/g.179160  ORF Transcript_62292/g.179160 Transcript_62292/m.179160 type:complete len:107 (-) Transcript_62292:24-344(-)
MRQLCVATECRRTQDGQHRDVARCMFLTLRACDLRGCASSRRRDARGRWARRVRWALPGTGLLAESLREVSRRDDDTSRFTGDLNRVRGRRLSAGVGAPSSERVVF